MGSETVLVVGGGIAGMSAAVEAAETGYDVVLLEAGVSLGGRVAQLNRYFPKLCHPACGLEINYQRIRNNPKITCGDCAKAATTQVKNAFNYGMDTVPAAYLPHPMAFPMRYVVSPEVIGTPEAEAIKSACKYGAVDLDEKPQTFDLHVAAVIWATGWSPYNAEKLESYGYGQIANVITNVEMERLAADTGPTQGRILRPSDGQEAKRVALIQCAGSRDLNHLPYCSRICCLASLKHAAYVREQYADSQVDIYYIDIRAHDKLESFYKKVKADPQVRFVKSKVASITEGDGGKPVLHGEDTLAREIYDRDYDLVVLAVGMEPTGGLPVANSMTDDYGFVVPHGDDGAIYSAGVASGPLDVSMSVQSATAAALKAIQAARGGATA
ncbi:MAG: FAD-dependent oxidoreductase [Alphaproteobacteria bacterium]